MIALPAAMKGRYKLAARKDDGRVRPLSDWFDNLILNAGLDAIATSATYLDACQVGTSAAAPTVAQTALVAAVAGTANRSAANSAAANAEPFGARSTITYDFAQGAVTGALREVGIGASATPGSALFSRALTPNVYGEAAEIEVFADEALQVQYELSVSPPAADVAGSFVIGNTTHSYTLRPALVSSGPVWAPYRASARASAGQAVQAIFPTGAGAHAILYSGPMGSKTSQPSGTATNCSSATNTAYTPGSFIRQASIKWLDSVANYGGGVRSALIQFAAVSGDGGNSLGAFQIEFSPTVPKTASEAFYLNVGVAWGRA